MAGATYDVTEEQLQKEKEIETPIDTLRWDYYQYILKHPIKHWSLPTSILYGGKDNLQPISSIQNFAKQFQAKLVIAENSEHPFMEQADSEIVVNWLSENI